MAHLPDHWIEKLCVLLSIPGWLDGHFAHEIVRFFTAWQKSEGGTAANDPLNTTDHVTDSFGKWQEDKDYNWIGVANYTTPFHGIAATAATLLESTVFMGIVADLRVAEANNYKAEDIVKRNVDELKTWGTNPTTMLDVLKTLK